jgi:hypothetical protein
MEQKIMMCVYSMDYYSVTKKNEIMSYVGKWLELEITVLSEINQAQKAKYSMFLLICAT